MISPFAPLMNRLIGGFIVGFGLHAAPAHARNLLELLGFGETPADCPVTDSACLRAAAYDETTQMLAGLGESNRLQTDTADIIAALLRSEPADERAAMTETLRAAIAVPEDFSMIENAIDDRPAGYWITVADLRYSLETGESSSTGPTDGFLELALQVLLERDAAERDVALATAMELRGQLGALAPGARAFLTGWTAEHAPEAFATLIADTTARDATTISTYETVGLAALQHCTAPATRPDGERVLAVMLPTVEEKWPDPVSQAYALANLYPAVLNCQGESAAQDWLGRISSLEPAMATFMSALYTDEQEAQFVADAVRDYISRRTAEELAWWLYQAGREDEAKVAQQAGPGLSVLTFGTDGTANLGSDVVPWDDFLTYRTEAPFYSEYPAEVLSSFNAGNMIDTTICCSWPDHAARVLDAIEAEWPDPAARQAAPAIVQFLRDAVSQNGNASYAYLVDDAVLRIGRIEKAHGCEIPQRALEGILSNLNKIEFASLRLQVLVSFVAYAEAEFGNPATMQGTCIIQ